MEEEEAEKMGGRGGVGVVMQDPSSVGAPGLPHLAIFHCSFGETLLASCSIVLIAKGTANCCRNLDSKKGLCLQ